MPYASDFYTRPTKKAFNCSQWQVIKQKEKQNPPQKLKKEQTIKKIATFDVSPYLFRLK